MRDWMKKEMAIIACRWNNADLEGDDAMYQIWKLYREDFLKIWNQPEVWGVSCSEETVKNNV